MNSTLNPPRRETYAEAMAPFTLEDWACLIGRVAMGALFLWSGFGKLAHMAPTVANMQAHGMPAADLLVWPVAFFELAVAAMMLAGWRIRWAALGMLAFTLFATLIFHAFWSVPPGQVASQQIHFLKNLAIMGGLLFAFAHGAGRIAMDTE